MTRPRISPLSAVFSRSRGLWRLGLILAAFAVLSAPAAAQPVDVALVLALDVSGSVEPDRWDLQREGIAAALRYRNVVSAMIGGERGAVFVTIVQWSGAEEQRQVVPWTRVASPADAEALAEVVDAMPRAFSDFTSISAAIDFSVTLLAGAEATRRVIDVSGDGSNNNGRPVWDARDEAVAAGITVNGLPIEGNEGGLVQYYGEHVAGGEGSFTIPAQGFEDFPRAMRAKLEREIAGTPRHYAEAR